MDPSTVQAALLPALLAVAVVGGIAVLLGQPAWARRRRERLRAAPLPGAWVRIVESRVPIVRRLPAQLRRRLFGHVRIFVAEKPFIGCAGQSVDDEVRLVVAAQACLLLLGSDAVEPYPRLRQVLVYPDAFIVPRRQLLPGGVVSEQRQALAGESWSQGQVILAWSEVLAGAADPDDGRNVVLHEFAHQVDQDGGAADGRPWIAGEAARRRFAAAMDEGLGRLRDAGEPFVDAYGGSGPEEFFAVATESFFERPAALAEHAPAVYAELARLYRVDPLRWSAAAPAGDR